MEAMLNRIARAAAVTLFLFAACGCADVNPTRAGYLSDYAQLRPQAPDDRQVELRLPSPADLAAIDSFLIEDVAWRATRTKKAATTPAGQARVLNVLRQSLRDELGKVRPVVDRPGPRTARVRAAVTDEVESDVILNIIMTFIAVPVSNGGATVEAELLGPEGRQIAAIDFARPGGIIDIFGYYLPDGHAQHATRSAARRLREIFEAVRVGGER
jgi:hypothetical protein